MLDRLARTLRNALGAGGEPAPGLARLRWPLLTASGPGASTGREEPEEDPSGSGPHARDEAAERAAGAAAPVEQHGGRRRSAA